jgi:hypothetical protein
MEPKTTPGAASDRGNPVPLSAAQTEPARMNLTRLAIAAAGAAAFGLSVVIKYAPSVLDLIGGVDNQVTVGLLWLLPIEAALLFALLTRSGIRILRSIAHSRSHRAIAGAAVLFLIFSLMPHDEEGRLMIAYLALASVGSLLLLYGLYPLYCRRLAGLESAADFLTRRLKLGWFLLLTAGSTFLIANFVSWVAFQHAPHIQDSVNYVLQARIFASGHVWLKPTWSDYFFSYSAVINDGVRYSTIATFAHPLLLLPAVMIGIEWIVNPLLGGLAIVALYFLGRELYDERIARISALLGVFSPFLSFMSSEYMNHVPALLFMTLFLLFFMRTVRGPGIINPLIGGAVLGFALNIRPLTAFAIALPAAVYGFYLLFRPARIAHDTRTRLIGRFAIFALPAVIGLGLFYFYNYLLTGDPGMSGYKAYGILDLHHKNWGLGFGIRGWEGWGAHTPLRGLIQTGNNLNGLNKYLFETPIPGLLPAALLFVTLAAGFADYLLLSIFISLAGAYVFYWYQDLCFGPRFMFEGLTAILLLTARGLVTFPRFVVEFARPPPPDPGLSSPDPRRVRARRATLATTVFCALTALCVGIPQQLGVYSNRYWGVDGNFRRAVQRYNISNALVFMDVDSPPDYDNFYGSGYQANSLDFLGPVIYARDQGEDNYVLMKRLPGRRYYFASPGALLEIDTTRYRTTPAIEDLLKASDFVQHLDTGDYRFVLLPFREVDQWFTCGRAQFEEYRDASSKLFQRKLEFEDYLPALGVISLDDRREYLSLFDVMKDLESFIIGGFRFTLLFQAPHDKWAVYDIRPVTGTEIIIPPAKRDSTERPDTDR